MQGWCGGVQCARPGGGHGMRGKRLAVGDGDAVHHTVRSATGEGGLVVKIHSLLYHSTLGLRVIQKKKKKPCLGLSDSG